MGSTAASLRDQPSVTVPVERPERYPQTLLRHFDRCRHSGYLYLRHGGGAPSHELDRGSAFHKFAERATRHLIEQNENRLPPEVAKDMMAEVVADPRFTIPASEVDGLRVMAYHFAEGVLIRPEEVVAVEQKFVLELAGATVSGKIDLAWLRDQTAGVRDYKSSYHLISQDEFDNSFQTILYALLLAFGRPVTGLSIDGDEILGPPLAERAQEFELAEVYPRYLWDDGLATRRRTITRAELYDHRLFMEGLIGKVEHAFETGEWPAVPGSHCSECPAAEECPLPARLRGYQGALIDSDESAQTAAMLWLFQRQDADDLWKELKAHGSRRGPIPLGEDLVLDFSHRASEEIRDKDELEAAIQRSIQFGVPFERDDHFKQRQSTTFRKRKLTEEERDGVRRRDETDDRAEPEPVGSRYGDSHPF